MHKMRDGMDAQEMTDRPDMMEMGEGGEGVSPVDQLAAIADRMSQAAAAMKQIMVHRKTQRGRMIRKTEGIATELKRRMHTRLREQHGWLARVLRGHYAYFGVTDEIWPSTLPDAQAVRAWHGAIRRRDESAEFVLTFQIALSRTIHCRRRGSCRRRFEDKV